MTPAEFQTGHIDGDSLHFPVHFPGQNVFTFGKVFVGLELKITHDCEQTVQFALQGQSLLHRHIILVQKAKKKLRFKKPLFLDAFPDNDRSIQ